MKLLSQVDLADFDAVEAALESVAENNDCGMSVGIDRKLRHVKQILQGRNGSKRHQNWLAKSN